MSEPVSNKTLRKTISPTISIMISTWYLCYWIVNIFIAFNPCKWLGSCLAMCRLFSCSLGTYSTGGGDDATCSFRAFISWRA
jgi:hypothetical protein